MTRTAAPKVYANFTGGLITEANTLSYPENAASSLVNLDIQEDGSLTRRAGLEFDSSDSIDINLGGNLLFETATNIYLWESVSGDNSLDIAVVQIGDLLNFYYVKDNKISDSSVIAADPITLSDTVRQSDSTLSLRKSKSLQMTSGGGRLYVAGKYIDPFVLNFTKPSVPFTKGVIEKKDLILKVRDFKIWKEGERIGDYSSSGEDRQDYMSAYHFYNLANQGYPSQLDDGSGNFPDVLFEAESKVSSASDPDGGTSDEKAASYTENRMGFFPTTSDTYHAYQAGGGQTITEQIAYSPWLLENDYTGNTPSPRGKFINEAFYIRRRAVVKELDAGSASRTQEMTDALNVEEIETAKTRPEAISFYAGRVWYAGLEGDQFTNNIYYSQIIGDDINKASKCYQEADPTAEVINELVDTDGGVFNLEEIGKIFKMEPIGPSLAVVADNGVWVISGDGEFSSFTATSFSIRKITDQGATSDKTVVFAKDSMYYWGDSAIYRLAIGSSGALESQDISASTIKTLYQGISKPSKEASFSVFDEGSNKVLWFYPDVEDNIQFSALPYKGYNKVIYFDTSLGAFGSYSIDLDPAILPVSAVSSSSSNTINVQDAVTLSGIQVTDSGANIYISSDAFVEDVSTIKILTISTTSNNISYRFSGFTDIINWSDWGRDSPAVVESGFDSLSNIIGKGKQAPIMQVHLERTETGFTSNTDEELIPNRPSSCLVSYAWDWSDNFSTPFQAYRLLRNYTPENSNDPFDYSQSVITTRNRVRGRGISLGVRASSEAGKDMKLLGYGIVFTSRRRP